MSVTLLGSGAAAFASGQPGMDDAVRAENRAEREALGAFPNTRRGDDALSDAAERARDRHDHGAPLVGDPGITARLQRVDDAKGDAAQRARRDGATRDAHIARVLDKRGDRREREEHETWVTHLALEALRQGTFRKDSSYQAKQDEDPRYQREQEKRSDTKGSSDPATSERKSDRVDNNDRREQQEEGQRQRLEERLQQKADAAAEKKADAAERKADAAAEKKADRDERLKDRADDRKDVRTDNKIDAAADKKTP